MAGRTYFLSKKGVVAILRWLLLFVVAYLVATGTVTSYRFFVALLAVYAASNVLVGLASEDFFRRWRLNYVVVFVDVVFISAAIYLTGDLELYFFYFFTILLAAYGRQVRGSVAIAVLASLFYLWVVLYRGSWEALFSLGVLIRIPFFYLVAMLSSFMAEESRSEQEKLRRTQVILGMTQEMGRLRDPGEMLGVLAASLRRLPKVRDIRVFYFQPEGYSLLTPEAPFPREEGPFFTAGEVGLPGDYRLFEGETCSVPHLPAPGEGDAAVRPPGARSLAAAPFLLRRGECGLLAVYAETYEAFTGEDAEIVEIAALSLARSLDNLVSFHEIEVRAAELSSLVEVSRIINSSLDLQEVLRCVTEQSRLTFGTGGSSILLVEESTKELIRPGDSPAGGEAGRFPPGEGVAGWVAREGEPLVVNDAAAEPRYRPEVDGDGEGGAVRNLMAVPMKVRGRVNGVLSVRNRRGGGFSGEDLRLFGVFAEQAAIAVDKARLYRYMEDQVNETIDMYLKLEQEKSQVDTILSSMIEGVIVTDPGGEVMVMNDAARSVLKPGGGEWLPEYTRVRELLDEARRVQSHLTEKITLPAPERRVFALRAAPIVTAAGKVLGSVAVLEDVTELTRLSEMKSEFISQVSHELRTPLTSIRGAMNLLLRGRAGELGEQQRELAGMVQDESIQMAELINELLDLSKLESGQIHVQPERVGLVPILEKAVEGVRLLLEEKGLAFDWERDPGIAEVLADPERIGRVVTNLLGNAVKYTPAGRRVTLGYGRDASGGSAPMVCIWVRDTGDGIPAEDRRRIFEKFQRGRAGTDGVTGTGLGLAIARQIVEDHGGRIWVESEVGEGSCFTFTVPLPSGAVQGNDDAGRRP